MPEPLFSILIVNWNGRAVLPRCLAALKAQVNQDYEIILFDNGSQDDSLAFVRDNYPDVRIFPSRRNIGFAAGSLDFIHNLLCGCLVCTRTVPGTARIVDHYFGAMLRQHFGIFRPDTSARTRDDADAPFT